MTFKARLILSSALVLGMAAVAAAPARADIVTSLSAVPTLQSDGTYAYTYNVQLGATSQLDGTATTSSTGVVVGNSEFGTIYDFGPTVKNADGTTKLLTTGVLSTFTFSFSNSNTAAPNTITNPTDNPALGNIRFTYGLTNSLYYIDGQGVSPPAGTAVATALQPGSANLGTFTVYSVYGPNLNQGLAYDGVSYKSTNNTQQQNLGMVSGPSLVTAVPEPASLALLGAGLVGAGLIRRRKAV